MKVAQNDETNPDAQPVHPPHIPSIENTQLSPSGSSVRKRETPGMLFRMFPPFAGITSYRVRAHLTPLLVMSCIDMHLFAMYLLFLPLFSSVDPVTMLMPLWSTTSPTAPPSRLSFQASPPFDHPDIAHSILLCLH